MDTKVRLAQLCLEFQRTAALRQEALRGNGFRSQSWIVTGGAGMTGPFWIQYATFPAEGDAWVTTYQTGTVIGRTRAAAIGWLLEHRGIWPLHEHERRLMQASRPVE